MLPASSKETIQDIQSVDMPTKTYFLNLDTDPPRVRGFTDGLEAMTQAVYKIINTERYQYPIYSTNYGVELEALIGQPTSFVLPEIKRRITEALMQDDRVTGVDGWEFDHYHGKVGAAFTVVTIFGDVPAETEVSV